MDAAKDFLSGWHFSHDVERRHFTRQTLLYLSVLDSRMANLVEQSTTSELPPHALIACYEELHMEYRMRFWACESIADLVRRREMTLFQGIGVTRSALKVALALFRHPDEPSLALLRDVRGEFRRLWPQGDHQIIVAYDPEAPDVSVHDEYSWLRRFYDPLRGPVLGAQWAVIEAVATPPAVATATSDSAPCVGFPTSPIRLTQSQSDCADVLRSYWLAQKDGLAAGGYGMRPPLLAARSGSGKTRLVRWLADLLRLPLITLDIGSWLLNGSRAEKPTLTLLREFHEQYQEGLVFFDELDKASGRDGGWWQGVNMELMSYLDGRLSWPADLTTKIRSQFLTIGAGTWQSVFHAQKRDLGFGQRSADVDVSRAIEESFGSDSLAIPQELAFRFDSPIVLHPPNAEEFAERIKAIRKENGFSAANPPVLDAPVDDAVQSTRGQRWLESYASRMLRQRLLAEEREDWLHFLGNV